MNAGTFGNDGAMVQWCKKRNQTLDIKVVFIYYILYIL